MMKISTPKGDFKINNHYIEAEIKKLVDENERLRKENSILRIENFELTKTKLVEHEYKDNINNWPSQFFIT